jgi:hypothetical protein
LQHGAGLARAELVGGGAVLGGDGVHQIADLSSSGSPLRYSGRWSVRPSASGQRRRR